MTNATKQERAKRIKVGDRLIPLKSKQWFLPDGLYEVLKVIPEGERGAFPLFEIKRDGEHRDVLSYKFFNI